MTDRDRCGEAGALSKRDKTHRIRARPCDADGNPTTRTCRGLIVHSTTGRVLARPWAKFVNHGRPEAETLDLAAPVEVTDKLDGSLGILYPHQRPRAFRVISLPTRPRPDPPTRVSWFDPLNDFVPLMEAIGSLAPSVAATDPQTAAPPA